MNSTKRVSFVCCARGVSYAMLVVSASIAFSVTDRTVHRAAGTASTRDVTSVVIVFLLLATLVWLGQLTQAQDQRCHRDCLRSFELCVLSPCFGINTSFRCPRLQSVFLHALAQNEIAVVRVAPHPEWRDAHGSRFSPARIVALMPQRVPAERPEHQRVRTMLCTFTSMPLEAKLARLACLCIAAP